MTKRALESLKSIVEPGRNSPDNYREEKPVEVSEISFVSIVYLGYRPFVLFCSRYVDEILSALPAIVISHLSCLYLPIYTINLLNLAGRFVRIKVETEA